MRGPPRVVGMVIEMRFAEELDDADVEFWEEPEHWPPQMAASFPMINAHTGRRYGTTRPLRAAATPDRMAVRIELDLSDVAPPGS